MTNADSYANNHVPPRVPKVARDAGAPTHRVGNREAKAKRALRFLRSLPQTIEAQVRDRPYRALGVAGAVGFGGGVLFGSRLLRSAAGSALTVAALEMLRGYVIDRVAQSRRGRPRSDADFVVTTSSGDHS
jgi:hypothetical protein